MSDSDNADDRSVDDRNADSENTGDHRRNRTPRIAVFRPDDDRLTAATSLLCDLGTIPIPDPMLAVEPTGENPRTDADYAILTSKTGAELVAESEWVFENAICAIGDRTARALRSAGYDVDLVPEKFSSAGLVATLEDRVDGARVEVARSDHGSQVLLDGLESAGAYVHETVLYALTRPPSSGDSTEAAAAGELEGALFTSSLTLRNFLAAARERGIEAEAKAGLNEAVVGAIGEPTRETAENAGVGVDVVPERASFEDLARAVRSRLDR